MLKRTENVSPADWLVNRSISARQVLHFGPAGFEAYARVRYLPDPDASGRPESEVLSGPPETTDTEVARRTLIHLAAFTEAADECFVCVTDGLNRHGTAPTATGGPLLDLPDRSYALFAGRLSDLTGLRPGFVPAFVFPADRRWCFASEVDSHWAGVGASATAIDALLLADDIDAVAHPDPTAPGPFYE